MRRRRLLALPGAALVASCARPPQRGTEPVGRVVAALDDAPPPVPREFRAAWVATVANIDWPSRKGLPVAEQQAEMLALLDRAREIGLNAIILQVRPSADAIYPSALEPWTEYLSGEQGRAPEPAWDPLASWIAEAHARGLELHAWFNPYRARAAPATSAFAATHLAVARPELVRRYGDLHWIDPGEPAAAEHTLAVIVDVMRRYDIDGVHIDDYFYPYPVEAGGRELDFPDGPSWQRYRAGGGQLARADWRRRNVDQLVERLHRAVRAEKPWLRLGISPFGIGRPDRRPAGIQGFSQFDRLYADVERWLEAGWLDYLAPQLYWSIGPQALAGRPAPSRAANGAVAPRCGDPGGRASHPQAFGALFDYWHRANAQGRHIWPGLYTSRLQREPGGAGAWGAEELLAQIELIRACRPGVGGHAHFSMVALLQDRDGIAVRLQTGPYAASALVPASPWLGTDAPPAPVVSMARVVGAERLLVRIDRAGGASIARHALWWRGSDALWHLRIEPAAATRFEIDPPAGQRIEAVVLSAVDRLGNESERVSLDLRRPLPTLPG